MITITTVTDRLGADAEPATTQQPSSPAPATAVDVAILREVVDGVRDHLDQVDRKLMAVEALGGDVAAQQAARPVMPPDSKGVSAPRADETEAGREVVVPATSAEDSRGTEVFLGSATSFGPPEPGQQALYLSRGFAVVELSKEQQTRLEAFQRSSQVADIDLAGTVEAGRTTGAPPATMGRDQRRTRRQRSIL